MAEKTPLAQRGQDRIRIGAYIPFHPDRVDEEHVRLLAQAGVDLAVVYLDGIPDKQKELFGWMAKYGVEAALDYNGWSKFFHGARLYDETKKDTAWFADEPAFRAMSFVDEPGTEHFDELGKSVAQFRRDFPGKTAYINLMPMYANAVQLTGGSWKSAIEYYETPGTTYRQYLEEYIAKVDTDYICADIYPCRREPDPACPDDFPAVYRSTTYDNYIRAIEIVADACRASGRDFWCCLQSCSWSKDVREPSEAELRWQFFTLLSYGVKTFLYFVFACYSNHTGACLNERGEKTKLFLASQRISAELKKLSATYMQYKNLGAFNVNSSPETTPYLEMDHPCIGFTAIREIQADAPLLVGCFEKKDGCGKAFTLVNMQDFADPKPVNVKLAADGVLTIYRGGAPERLTPVNGVYAVTLEQGDGVFVTID